MLPVFLPLSFAETRAQCDSSVRATGPSWATGTVCEPAPANTFAQQVGPYTDPTPYGYYSIAQPGDGFVYIAKANQNPDGSSSPTAAVYKLSTTAPPGTAPTYTGWGPDVLFGGTYCISGASDLQGNIYFITGHGDQLAKVVPSTGAVSYVWTSAPTHTTGNHSSLKNSKI